MSVHSSSARTFTGSLRCTAKEFLLSEKLYMCTHVVGRTACYHYGWYFKDKGLWSPRGKLNSCIPNALYLAAHCRSPIKSNIQRNKCPDSIWAPHQVNPVQSEGNRCLFMQFSAAGSFPFWTSAADVHLCRGHDTRGEPTVSFFSFPPCSPLTHGCYQDELSANQLSAHIC